MDLRNKTFGRLKVMNQVNHPSGRSYWNCRCECGNEKVIYSGSLTLGRTVSCGCFQRQRRSESHTKHGAWKGGAETATHRSWRNMMGRCYRIQNNRFEHYGARGIGVCARWHDFKNFLADMGERPEGLTLERIKTQRGYSKSNCRWASWMEQENNRRNNRNLSLNGKTMTMSQWSRETGISVGTIHARLKRGWKTADALSKPARGE